MKKFLCAVLCSALLTGIAATAYAAEAPSEVIGEEVRKLYSWSNEDKLINN